jgi:hypothetical protein
MAADNQALLLESLRERYRYHCEMWREAREERRIDMRYISGDPWDEEDRKARIEAGRPCINHDELGQYVNACVNNLRQNKRGIKIEPAGNGATDKTAETRQGLVRAIEYRSKAQSVYLTAYQAMVEGSYGFARVSRRYKSDESFDQEIVLKTIANPDSVSVDPDCKEADWSDMRDAFVLDPMSHDEFKRRWPNAEIKDFSAEHMRVAKDWIQDKQVLVAEWWRVEIEPGFLYLLADGSSVRELKPGQNAIKRRPVERKKLVQRFTNGIEILEETEQPGELIPIIPFIGMQRFIDDGSGAKRKLYSLVRLARDPQMSHAYLCSQEMEEAGLTPKTPYTGYTGQFETDKEAWETVTKIPHAYLQADPIVDQATGQVLPLPQRQQFTPNFQAYEMAKDSCRRAIQAAMGINPLPTAAQRGNQKSGVALERIEQQQEIGSFHFVDGYDRALEYAGRVIDGWIPATYDTEREEALRKPDDSHQMVKLNTEEPYLDDKTQALEHHVIDDSNHDVTISTGPSAQSQRDAADTFLEQLIGNLHQLPLAPPQMAKLLAMAIRMKQLGPQGDEMADIVSPPDQGQQLPPQAQQAMQQAKQESQALYAHVQQLQAEVQKLQLEQKAKVIDNQFKLGIERMKIEAGIAEAEIATKAQSASERNQFVADSWSQLHGQAHEAALQADDQAHQQGLADQQAQLQAQQQAQPQADQQGQQQQ